MKNQLNACLWLIIAGIMMLAGTPQAVAQTSKNSQPEGRLIGTVKSKNGTTIYLMEQKRDGVNAITSYNKNESGYAKVDAFKVKGNYCPVIKSVKHESWTTSAPDEAFFLFNKADNSLYIPLINITTTYYGGAEHDLVTSADRYLVYQFDGEHFVYKRKDAGFWLHKDLRSFESLVYVGKSKDYLIRIDRTKEGFRYAAWKGQNDMTSKPNLVLIGKIRLTHGVQLDLGFGFENKGYTYEVWTKDYPKGPQLVVRQGDKVLLQQGLREIVSNPNY